MALAEKYAKVLSVAKELSVEGLSSEESGGKFHIVGTAPYQLEKDLVWDAVKAISGWEAELDCNLGVKNADPYGFWVVKPGDSLSKIAKKCYDDGNKYMKIFEANKDILKDPNTIKPGQKLKIPKV
jgi:nucleoid-associated protein YgaU